MLRALFNLSAILSLLFAIAFASFWVRSQYVSDRVLHLNERSYFFCQTTRTGLWIGLMGMDLSPKGKWTYARLTPSRITNLMIDNLGEPQVSFLDVVVRTGVERPIALDEAHVPYWLLLAVTAALPIAWVVCRHRLWRNKHRGGLCPQCGYDLRGTLPNAGCPECGAVRA